ncbi:MAG: hypothetical protein H6706_01675 [Myxococcales bacterium]|nr:hypothetical protein [Myxococcales bacterium]
MAGPDAPEPTPLERLEEAVLAAPTPGERARARLALAEYRRDELHQPDAAVPVFEAVLDEARPGTATWLEALEALEDLHALRHAWDAVLALYDRRGAAGLLDATERAILRAATLRAPLAGSTRPSPRPARRCPRPGRWCSRPSCSRPSTGRGRPPSCCWPTSSACRRPTPPRSCAEAAALLADAEPARAAALPGRGLA